MTNEQRTEVAKKIARLLAESKATFYDLQEIDCRVKDYLGFAFVDSDENEKRGITLLGKRL